MECNHCLGKVPDLVYGVERYQQNAVGLTSMHSIDSGTNLLDRRWTLSYSGIVHVETCQAAVGLLTNHWLGCCTDGLSRWMRGSPSLSCVMQREKLLLLFAQMRFVARQQWLVSCLAQQPRLQINLTATQIRRLNFKYWSWTQHKLNTMSIQTSFTLWAPNPFCNF